jgi:hypothetical protein
MPWSAPRSLDREDGRYGGRRLIGEALDRFLSAVQLSAQTLMGFALGWLVR